MMSLTGQGGPPGSEGGSWRGCSSEFGTHGPWTRVRSRSRTLPSKLLLKKGNSEKGVTGGVYSCSEPEETQLNSG